MIKGKSRAGYVFKNEWVGPLMWQSKTRAKKKGLSFTLTYELMAEMVKRAAGRCEVTGIPFRFGEWEKGRHQKRPYAPSIDRIDANGGYVFENCRLVCVCVNNGMGKWGEEILGEMARAYVDKHGARVASDMDKMQQFERDYIECRDLCNYIYQNYKKEVGELQEDNDRLRDIHADWSERSEEMNRRMALRIRGPV